MSALLSCSRPLPSLVFLLAVSVPASAQELVRLRESLAIGDLYQVQMQVDLSGLLTLPLEKGETRPRQLAVKGQSTIQYIERILRLNRANQVERTIRQYQKMDFDRKVGDQLQQGNLRPQIRRLVLLRHQQVEVPFSPDGPLTWNEIDLVRTDVFTPALLGLLPEGPVRPGDSWNASTSAVQELTDFERIERGNLLCRFEEITVRAGQRQARISFRGTIEGIGEDGRSKHEIQGHLYFDLQGSFLAAISMQAAQYLPGKDGASAGKVEGSFTLSRQHVRHCRELDNDEIRRLNLEPGEDNTQLLYEHPDLGVRLLYPRTWRVAGVRGRQVGIDERKGSGLLLTVEAPGRTPTGQQFFEESRTYLQQQKAKVINTTPVAVWQRTPRLIESFVIDIEVERQRVRMLYVVIRENTAGAVVAARLPIDQNLVALQREVQRIAMSVQLGK